MQIKIYYDSEKTKEIEDRIWSKWGEREKDWAKQGYNVSECTYCEMKCFNQRTGMPVKITKKSIGFLVFGIVSEEIVTAIFPEDQRQYEANLNEKIWGHLDAFENFEFPLEGKATAKRIFKRDQIPENWAMQLINYLTLTGKNKGWLLVLDIFTRSFSAWCFEIDSATILTQIEVLMEKTTRFDKAIPIKDTSGLTISPEEYDLCHFKHDCLRKEECHTKWKELEKAKKPK
jgi:hypothetical protein